MLLQWSFERRSFHQNMRCPCLRLEAGIVATDGAIIASSRQGGSRPLLLWLAAGVASSGACSCLPMAVCVSACLSVDLDLDLDYETFDKPPFHQMKNKCFFHLPSSFVFLRFIFVLSAKDRRQLKLSLRQYLELPHVLFHACLGLALLTHPNKRTRPR